MKLLSRLHSELASGVGHIGRASMLTFSTFRMIFRRPYELAPLLKQLHYVGVKALLVVIITGVVVGLVSAVQAFYQLKELSAQGMIGSFVTLTVVKELGPIGFLSESDWPKLTIAAGKLSESPIFIDDTPGIGVMELRARARRLKAEHDVGLIMIDYLQLMQGRGKVESRQQEISDISRALKGLAKELDLPIIACSQLSRQVENRPDKRPQLSDLRESGAIEQDADLVLFLYREEYYEREMSTAPGMAEVIIGKQRNGPTGKVDLVFSANQMKFQNMEKRYVR